MAGENKSENHSNDQSPPGARSGTSNDLLNTSGRAYGKFRKAALPGLILLFVILYFLVPGAIKTKHLNMSERHLSKFTLIEDIDAYKEAMPKSYFGDTKHKHAVLLLHGYSASPQEFDLLAEGLKAANIPFYAPLMTGYGLNRFDLLGNVVPGDWLRDGVLGYQLLAFAAVNLAQDWCRFVR